MPTFQHGKSTKVLVGSYDLSTYLKEFTAGTQIDMAETSAFGNAYKTYVQGIGDSGISLSGMWATGGASAVDDVFTAAIASSATLPVIVAPQGYGYGNKGFGIGANQASYEITASIGDVVSVSAEFQSNVDSGGRSGVFLTPGTAITASTSFTGQDNAAATTNSGYALLSIVANSWTGGTATVEVQDSADNASWATIGTFTAQADPGTITSQYLAISGTIRRYARFRMQFSAGSGSVLPHVLLVRS